jgi:hypothetical protein
MLIWSISSSVQLLHSKFILADIKKMATLFFI